MTSTLRRAHECTCTVTRIVSGAATLHCLGTNSLPGGQISVQGLAAPGEPFELAITGGTGRYRQARGQVFGENTSPTDRRRFTMRARAWLCVAALPVVALTGGCGGGDDSEPGSAASKPSQDVTVLTVTDTSTPGNWSFDKKSLTAEAGKVTLELHNPSDLGHNVRVQSGDKCCFGPDSKDLGGTPVIGGLSDDAGKTARATLDLKPGRYWFLCANPGHWQAGQRGSLVVN